MIRKEKLEQLKEIVENTGITFEYICDYIDFVQHQSGCVHEVRHFGNGISGGFSASDATGTAVSEGEECSALWR